MSRIAFVAEIRPGRKPDLERILAEGPPFDLAGRASSAIACSSATTTPCSCSRASTR